MLPRRFSPNVTVHFGPNWDDPENGHAGVGACLSWKIPVGETQRRNKMIVQPDYIVQKFNPSNGAKKLQPQIVNRKKPDNVSYRSAGYKIIKGVNKNIDEEALLDAIHQHQAEKNDLSSMELKRLAAKYTIDETRQMNSYNNKNLSRDSKQKQIQLVSRSDYPRSKSLITGNINKVIDWNTMKHINKGSISSKRLPSEIHFNSHPKTLVTNGNSRKYSNEEFHNYRNNVDFCYEPVTHAHYKTLIMKDHNRKYPNEEMYNYKDNFDVSYEPETYYSGDEISPCDSPIYLDNDCNFTYPASEREVIVYTDSKNEPIAYKKPGFNRQQVSFNRNKTIISDRKTPDITYEDAHSGRKSADGISLNIALENYPTFYNGYAKTADKKKKQNSLKSKKFLTEQNKTPSQDMKNMTVKVDCPNNPLSCITVQLDTPRGLHQKKYVVDKLVNKY